MDDGEIYRFLRQTGRTEQKYRDERPKNLPDDMSHGCLRLAAQPVLSFRLQRGAWCISHKKVWERAGGWKSSLFYFKSL